MQRFIIIAVFVLFVVLIVRLFTVYKNQVKFFATGQELGFKFSEIIALWKLSKISNLEEPMAIFVSVPTLNSAITNYISEQKMKGTENTAEVQAFLTKLYDFRTRLNLEHENKKGVDSTKYLEKGQKIRLILSGSGVFHSEIAGNGHELMIKLPLQKGALKFTGDEWVGKKISVYTWRKNDASYVFDSEVLRSGISNGFPVLYISHSNELLRVQKRKSVRCKCSIPAAMYFLKDEEIDYNVVETSPGYKVLIEDISEDGCMFRAGGKGIKNIKVKIQFYIAEKLIIMFGVVRAVEYNKNINQSRLHFECVHIEKEMKNTILSFVYNVLPQEEKDIYEAVNAEDEFNFEDVNNEENSNKKNKNLSENQEQNSPVKEKRQEEEQASLEILEGELSEAVTDDEV